MLRFDLVTLTPLTQYRIVTDNGDEVGEIRKIFNPKAAWRVMMYGRPRSSKGEGLTLREFDYAWWAMRKQLDLPYCPNVNDLLERITVEHVSAILDR